MVPPGSLALVLLPNTERKSTETVQRLMPPPREPRGHLARAGLVVPPGSLALVLLLNTKIKSTETAQRLRPPRGM